MKFFSKKYIQSPFRLDLTVISATNGNNSRRHSVTERVDKVFSLVVLASLLKPIIHLLWLTYKKKEAQSKPHPMVCVAYSYPIWENTVQEHLDNNLSKQLTAVWSGKAKKNCLGRLPLNTLRTMGIVSTPIHYPFSNTKAHRCTFAPDKETANKTSHW